MLISGSAAVRFVAKAKQSKKKVQRTVNILSGGQIYKYYRCAAPKLLLFDHPLQILPVRCTSVPYPFVRFYNLKNDLSSVLSSNSGFNIQHKERQRRGTSKCFAILIMPLISMLISGSAAVRFVAKAKQFKKRCSAPLTFYRVDKFINIIGALHLNCSSLTILYKYYRCAAPLCRILS
jgi:hypothetical protein